MIDSATGRYPSEEERGGQGKENVATHALLLWVRPACLFGRAAEVFHRQLFVNLGRFIEQLVRDAWKASCPAFPLQETAQQSRTDGTKQLHLDFQGSGLERGHGSGRIGAPQTKHDECCVCAV
jgi:hypothetical protein